MEINDNFSKYVHTHVLKTKNGMEVTQAMKDILSKESESHDYKMWPRQQI